MSLKRILAGILSASLVLTVALSGCNNGQSGSADPSSSTGEGSSAASAAESEDTGDKPEKLQAIVDSDTVGIIQPAADILERDEGIKTEFIVQSYDQSYTKIMTSIMGGTPIDVMITIVSGRRNLQLSRHDYPGGRLLICGTERRFVPGLCGAKQL